VDAEVRRRVRGFAYRLTGDGHLADDVAQETLARALASGAPRDLPWLFAVALNVVRTEARRASRRRVAPVPVDAVVDPRGTDPLSRMVAEEERMEFWSRVGRLPDREREALLLRFGEGFTCAQIAATLGTTPNSVSCLLHRGKEHLRALLSAGSVRP
jgi:RNA polymerase sigma-70 factor (ECF subfamily)